MKALVVDDESLVRSELVYALGKVAPDFRITEAADAVEALRHLAGEPYDVAFLDINLPGLSGLEATKVIAALPTPPHVVFVTADGTRAVDAFELAAVDYVVKPVSEARLARTVARLRTLRETQAAAPNGAPAAASRVALEDGDRMRLVRVADIRYMQANGHTVTARVFDGDLRWKGSLTEAATRISARASRLSGEPRTGGRGRAVLRGLVHAAGGRQDAQRGPDFAEFPSHRAEIARPLAPFRWQGDAVCHGANRAPCRSCRSSLRRVPSRSCASRARIRFSAGR
jgi:DNA-binding LytR/AlgR family response regulator